MRYYFLVCSAKKAQAATAALTWGPDTNIEAWNTSWKSTNQRPVSEMYMGHLFRQQNNMISSSIEPWRVFVVSAGGGLLRGPASDGLHEDIIPSYEVHCASGSIMTPSKMRTLWDDGSFNEAESSEWSKVEWTESNEAVFCLPTAYMEAVLPSLRQEILEKNPSMKVYVMGSLPNHLRHHLNGIDLEVVGGEKGQREAMKAGFTEFRTRVLEHWLNDSLPKPVPVKKNPRVRLSDEDLIATIVDMFPEGPPSIQTTLRTLRENGFAASLERVRFAISTRES